MVVACQRVNPWDTVAMIPGRISSWKHTATSAKRNRLLCLNRFDLHRPITDIGFNKGPHSQSWSLDVEVHLETRVFTCRNLY